MIAFISFAQNRILFYKSKTIHVIWIVPCIIHDFVLHKNRIRPLNTNRVNCFFFLDGFSTIYPIILTVKYFYFHNPPLMASGKLCYVPWSFLTAAHKVYNCLLIIIKVLKVLYVVTKKWRHKRTTNVMNINVHFKCTVKTPVLFFSICLINTQWDKYQ